MPEPDKEIAGKRIAALGIASMLFVRLAADVYWLKLNPHPFCAFMRIQGFQFAHTFNEGGFTAFVELFFAQDYYPPLLPALIGLTRAVLKAGNYSGAIVNIVLFAFAAYAINGIFRKITEKTWPGLLAVFLFLTSPYLVFFTRSPMLEATLAALGPVVLWAFIRSNGFSSWRRCLAAGFAVGVGLMIKWSFLYVVWGIIAYAGIEALAHVLRQDGRERVREIIRQCRGVIVFALIAAAVTLPWYLLSLNMEKVRVGAQADPLAGGLIVQATWYLHILWSKFYSLEIAMLIATAVPVAFAVRFSSASRMALTGFLAAYVALIAIPHKNVRYLAPLLFYFPILIVIGLEKLSRVNLKALRIVALVIAIALPTAAAGRFATLGLKPGLYPFPTGDIRQINPECLRGFAGYRRQIEKTLDETGSGELAIFAVHPLTAPNSSFSLDLMQLIVQANNLRESKAYEVRGYEVIDYARFEELLPKLDVLLVQKEIWDISSEQMAKLMKDSVNFASPGQAPPPAPEDYLFKERILADFTLKETVNAKCDGDLEIYVHK